MAPIAQNSPFWGQKCVFLLTDIHFLDKSSKKLFPSWLDTRGTTFFCSLHCRTGFWERGYARGAFCQKCPIYGQFGPLWTSVRPPNDNFWRNKWYQTIALNVPHLDPTLIHTDPPVCSRQGDIWPQKGHLWHFWAISAPYGAPLWPFRIRKMVPTHHPGCAQPWSNLDPHWSTSL